jgi:ATP adenylyltransferase|tara:strand:- start:1139 stop:1681 length:543 start_codon:yes stop_codon:yes gene_type:complete
MDQLFAPWRMKWVSRSGLDDLSDECVFCNVYKLEDDKNKGLIAENRHAYVILNNYPYNPGHLMVIPKEHVGSYVELEEEVLLAHAKLKVRALKALEVAFEPQGFNTGLNLGKGSGGSINDHMHTHIVPRWEGDSNFMPILSDTKIIVEGMEETYCKLHEAFAEQKGIKYRGEDRSILIED